MHWCFMVFDWFHFFLQEQYLLIGPDGKETIINPASHNVAKALHEGTCIVEATLELNNAHKIVEALVVKTIENEAKKLCQPNENSLFRRSDKVSLQVRI